MSGEKRNAQANTPLRTESDSTLNDANFSRTDGHAAHLSDNVKRSLLGDEEKIAVRVAKSAVLHALVNRKGINANA